MSFLRLFAFISILMFLSCANTVLHQPGGGDKRPIWIDQPTREFPEREFLSGLGTGDNRRDAENDALAALAKIFSVEIKVNQKTIQNYLEQETDGKAKSDFSSLLLGKTSARTIQKLKNVRIAKTHFQESEGIYYALAVLNRPETAAIYQTEIEHNRLKIKQYFEKYTASTQKMHRLKYLNITLAIIQLNNGLNAQLQIISGADMGAEPVSETELNAQKLVLMDHISFSISQTGTPNSQVESYLAERIAKIGFKRVEQNADFNFQFKFESMDSDINRDDIKALQWHLEIAVQDRIQNKTLTEFTKDKRSVGISKQAAEAKMSRSVKKVIDEDFFKEFNDYLNSL